VRRGLALLETLPKIDTTRIGSVGWSNGAHLPGGIVAGGIPKGAARHRLAAQLALWDPATYLSRKRGSAFLMAAPHVKTWKVYGGGHSPTRAAAKYWQAWMKRNL